MHFLQWCTTLTSWRLNRLKTSIVGYKKFIIIFLEIFKQFSRHTWSRQSVVVFFDSGNWARQSLWNVRWKFFVWNGWRGGIWRLLVLLVWLQLIFWSHVNLSCCIMCAYRTSCIWVKWRRWIPLLWIVIWRWRIVMNNWTSKWHAAARIIILVL